MILIVANWKMNGSLSGCNEFFKTKFNSSANIVVCPPFPLIHTALQFKKELNNSVEIGAQNCHHKQSGAFTGEVSAKLLAEMGASWVILGHSERRSLFSESNSLIKEKILAALDNELKVILCVGETLQEKMNGDTEKVIGNQIAQCIGDLSIAIKRDIVIAYEPVWAIGTGNIAVAENVVNICNFIRNCVGCGCQVIYGGSCTSENVQEFRRNGIDGLLVGGASLSPKSFAEIINKLVI